MSRRTLDGGKDAYHNIIMRVTETLMSKLPLRIGLNRGRDRRCACCESKRVVGLRASRKPEEDLLVQVDLRVVVKEVPLERSIPDDESYWGIGLSKLLCRQEIDGDPGDKEDVVESHEAGSGRCGDGKLDFSNASDVQASSVCG
jgi:hypothetical protein